MVVSFDTLMDRRTRDEWVQLATRVLRARLAPNCCVANEFLENAAARDSQSPVSSAYRLWSADNFARDGRWTDAARAYDATVDRSQVSTGPPELFDPTEGAL